MANELNIQEFVQFFMKGLSIIAIIIIIMIIYGLISERKNKSK